MCTVLFCGKGDSYQSLCYQYRIGRTTLGKIIPDTCEAILTALKDKYMKVPSTTEEWEGIAATFADKWDFPNCIGAVDVKHVAIQPPPKSCSMSDSHKEVRSIALLAVTDALGRVLWYCMGANGGENDAGVHGCSALVKALEDNTLNLPAHRQLPNGNEAKVPFVLIGDEAFPLKMHMMKPYPKRGLTDPQRVFNDRLNGVRRVSETMFGTLLHRFRVLADAMNLQADTAAGAIEACLALHNFLRTEGDMKYAQQVNERVARWYLDDSQDRPLFFRGNHTSVFARQMRDELRDYFWGVGLEPLQPGTPTP